MQGMELGHRDGKCSFESIIEKYQLRDPALALLAKIVHGANVENGTVALSPQAAGLTAIADRFALLCGTRHNEKFAAESPGVRRPLRVVPTADRGGVSAS